MKILRIKKGVSKKLSENFWSHEFDCQCTNPKCEWTYVSDDLLKKLEKFRKLKRKVYLNSGVNIWSGYRCPWHNYNGDFAGSDFSQHMWGLGVDTGSVNPKKDAKLAEQAGFDGIGIYHNRIHIDVRGKRARWVV